VELDKLFNQTDNAKDLLFSLFRVLASYLGDLLQVEIDRLNDLEGDEAFFLELFGFDVVQQREVAVGKGAILLNLRLFGDQDIIVMLALLFAL